MENKIFIACDTTSIKKIKNILKNSKSNKLCKSQPESGTQTKHDILGDGKWLDKKTKLSMSKVTKNNLQSRLNFNSRNIHRKDGL